MASLPVVQPTDSCRIIVFLSVMRCALVLCVRMTEPVWNHTYSKCNKNATKRSQTVYFTYIMSAYRDRKWQLAGGSSLGRNFRSTVQLNTCLVINMAQWNRHYINGWMLLVGVQQLVPLWRPYLEWPCRLSGPRIKLHLCSFYFCNTMVYTLSVTN